MSLRNEFYKNYIWNWIHFPPLYLDDPLEEMPLVEEFYVYYEDLVKWIRTVSTELYYADVFSGEMRENMAALFYSHHPTTEYEDATIREMKIRATLLETKYYINAINPDPKKLEKGVFQVELFTESDPKKLQGKIDDRMKRIRELHLKGKPYFDRFEYLFRIENEKKD